MPQTPVPGSLRLKNSFFTRIEVTANHDYDWQLQPAAEPAPVHIEFELYHTQREANSTEYSIVLSLCTEEPYLQTDPYQIAIEVFGAFELVDSTLPEDIVEQLVERHALTVLYGAARELVSILTARGPWRDVLLPLTFIRSQTAETNS